MGYFPIFIPAQIQLSILLKKNLHILCKVPVYPQTSKSTFIEGFLCLLLPSNVTLIGLNVSMQDRGPPRVLPKATKLCANNRGPRSLLSLGAQVLQNSEFPVGESKMRDTLWGLGSTLRSNLLIFFAVKMSK